MNRFSHWGKYVSVKHGSHRNKLAGTEGQTNEKEESWNTRQKSGSNRWKWKKGEKNVKINFKKRTDYEIIIARPFSPSPILFLPSRWLERGTILRDSERMKKKNKTAMTSAVAAITITCKSLASGGCWREGHQEDKLLQIRQERKKNGAAARTGTSKLYFQIEEGGRIKKKLLLVSFSQTRK